MEYSTTASPLNRLTMSIDPNKELFDSSAPPPASAPPPTPDLDDVEAREREIEGGVTGGDTTLHLSVSYCYVLLVRKYDFRDNGELASFLFSTSLKIPMQYETCDQQLHQKQTNNNA